MDLLVIDDFLLVQQILPGFMAAGISGRAENCTQHAKNQKDWPNFPPNFHALHLPMKNQKGTSCFAQQIPFCIIFSAAFLCRKTVPLAAKKTGVCAA